MVGLDGCFDFGGGHFGEVAVEDEFGLGGGVGGVVEDFAAVGVYAWGFLASFVVLAQAFVLFVDGGEDLVAEVWVVEVEGPDKEDGGEEVVFGYLVGVADFGVGDAGVVEAAEFAGVNLVGIVEFLDVGVEGQALDDGEKFGVEAVKHDVDGGVFFFESHAGDDAGAAGHERVEEGFGVLMTWVGSAEAARCIGGVEQCADGAVDGAVGGHDVVAAHGFESLVGHPLVLEVGGVVAGGQGTVEACADEGIVGELVWAGADAGADAGE